VNLKKFEEPIVLRWGMLEESGEIDEAITEWSYLFELKSPAHFIRREEMTSEDLFDRFVVRFENGYFEGKRDKVRESFMKRAQQMSIDEYREKFPQFEYTSVYAKIDIRTEKETYAFIVFSRDEKAPLDKVPEGYFSGDPPPAHAIFVKQKAGGRYVLANVRASSIPDFVRHMNYRDLKEVESMLEKGFAFRTEDQALIQSIDSMEELKKIR